MMPKEKITKDSGERVKFPTGMNRDISKDKARFDLIMPKDVPYKEQLLTRFAELMTRGAIKYSVAEEEVTIKEFLERVIEDLTCQDVGDIQIEMFTQKDIAEAVMRKDFEKIIQNLRKDKEKIELTGERKVQKKLRDYSKLEEQIQIKGKETKKLKQPLIYETGDLQKRQTHFYWKGREINAQSAQKLFQSARNILIMTIVLDKQEDIFVMGAIEDLECLKTLLKVLKKHLGIYKNLQLENSLTSNFLKLIWDTPRNWELARTTEEMDRFKESAFRHFMQWFCGEDDEDHAVAVLFNIMGFETTKYKIENGI